MSFGDVPKAPDATATSNTQQQYNIGAGTAQQNLNMVNQSNPLGSLNYAQTGTNADGTPQYTQTTSYSQPVQNILDNYLRTQGTTGQTASNLASNISGMYSQPPKIDSSTTLNQLTNWNDSYNQPIFDRQRSNLDAKLQAQGIQLGSDAYKNAQNVQARNEGDVRTQFFTQAQPLAYNQAVQTYQLPLQTLQQLQGISQPTSPTFGSTPTAQVQPANYAGAVQSNYDAQMKQYQNQQAGMWGLAGNVLGAGTRLATGGMFGGGFGGGGPVTYGTSNGPTAFYNYG